MNKRSFGPALGGQLAAGCYTLNRNMTSLPANELERGGLWLFYTTLLENIFKFFRVNYGINLDYIDMKDYAQSRTFKPRKSDQCLK
jgi:hypothetical protein